MDGKQFSSYLTIKWPRAIIEDIDVKQVALETKA
jgi:hypothetical protein